MSLSLSDLPPFDWLHNYRMKIIYEEMPPVYHHVLTEEMKRLVYTPLEELMKNGYE